MEGDEDAKEYIDMFLQVDQTRIRIELKYIKDEFSGKVDGDEYYLPSTKAFDLSCYDILNDIHRLENYTQKKSIDISYSIVLTNASLLWEQKAYSKKFQCDEFRVFDGKTLSGTINWNPPEVADKKGKNHLKSIKLDGTYSISWKTYREIKVEQHDKKQSNNTFKYTIFEVDKSKMQH